MLPLLHRCVVVAARGRQRSRLLLWQSKRYLLEMAKQEMRLVCAVSRFKTPQVQAVLVLARLSLFSVAGERE